MPSALSLFSTRPKFTTITDSMRSSTSPEILLSGLPARQSTPTTGERVLIVASETISLSKNGLQKPSLASLWSQSLWGSDGDEVYRLIDDLALQVLVDVFGSREDFIGQITGLGLAKAHGALLVKGCPAAFHELPNGPFYFRFTRSKGLEIK